jgi:hypothetical protein
MDGADFDVRLSRQECVEVIGGLTFLDLSDGGPVSPYAGEAGQRTALVERKPDVASLSLIELAAAARRPYLYRSTVTQMPPALPERRTASTIATPAKPSSMVGNITDGSAGESERRAVMAAATSA